MAKLSVSQSVSQFRLTRLIAGGVLAGLGFSAFLMSNSASANMTKTFTKQEQADVMAKGMWYDERTGLIWDRCSVGQSWNGTTCVGEPKKLFYKDLESTVTQLNAKNHLGYNSWTIPSYDQLSTILDCPVFQKDTTTYYENIPIGELLYYAPCAVDEQTKGVRVNQNLIINNMPEDEIPEGKSLANGYAYWSASNYKEHRNNSKLTIRFYNGRWYFGRLKSDFFPPDKQYARLIVTSLSKGDEALKQIDAQRKIQYDNWKAEQERIAKEKAELEAREEAERQKQKDEQARKEKEAYDKKTANFRKNLKVGDDATAGMVVEIKGDLIKIQTNDSQCSQRDYKGVCTNYIRTPVEKWVKRRDLYPAN